MYRLHADLQKDSRRLNEAVNFLFFCCYFVVVVVVAYTAGQINCQLSLSWQPPFSRSMCKKPLEWGCKEAPKRQDIAVIFLKTVLNWN